MARRLDSMRDYASLALRLTGAAIFGVHGYLKVFGGTERFAATIANIHLPYYFLYVGELVEFLGAMLLFFGLLVRLASLLLAIQMGVAVVKFHILYLHQGLVGGYELALSLMGAMVALFLLGSGPWSLDRKLFGWR
ncbi:MAG TPA: DoxX family protein [Acidobacteriota bacterium]|jgi:putative oxidoreductase